MREDRMLTRVGVFARGALSRFSLDSLAVYALALASEVPAILVRGTVVLVLAWTILGASGHSTGLAYGWIELSLIPTAWSVLALASPLGTGWWWRQRVGGRRPSGREQLAFGDAVELLQAQRSEPLVLPKGWFVLDAPTPDAAVCGDTLMLSRGLLESDHLPAVLAHELGHLATPDGRLAAAMNRLVLVAPRPPRGERALEDAGEERRVGVEVYDPRIATGLMALRILGWAVRGTLKFAGGGFGLWLTGPIWGAYWRGREYRADAFAASLGQAEELADFLENHTLIHDRPVPFIWRSEHAHPPAELRIDRLRGAGGDMRLSP